MRALGNACAGKEVHFIRRALDQTQKDFAEAMDLSAEHVSRWENDHKGIGAASENLVRHNVCALLSEGCEYDPKTIAKIPYPDDGLPPTEMVRVRVPHRAKRGRHHVERSCLIIKQTLLRRGFLFLIGPFVWRQRGSFGAKRSNSLFYQAETETL